MVPALVLHATTGNQAPLLVWLSNLVLQFRLLMPPWQLRCNTLEFRAKNLALLQKSSLQKCCCRQGHGASSLHLTHKTSDAVQRTVRSTAMRICRISPRQAATPAGPLMPLRGVQGPGVSLGQESGWPRHPRCGLPRQCTAGAACRSDRGWRPSSLGHLPQGRWPPASCAYA